MRACVRVGVRAGVRAREYTLPGTLALQIYIDPTDCVLSSGPTPTSEFELSSICSTAKDLFNLSSYLTKRDAWAGSFEHLLLDSPRPDDDCPMHLPDAPAPWTPSPKPHEKNITCGSFVRGDGCHGGKCVPL